MINELKEKLFVTVLLFEILTWQYRFRSNTAVGMNLDCVYNGFETISRIQISVARNAPLEWITKQFLNKDIQNMSRHMLPKFVVTTDNTVLNLSISNGVTSRDNKSAESVVVNCNLHHNGPFNAISEIQAKMEDWRNDKSIIISHLKDILG